MKRYIGNTGEVYIMEEDRKPVRPFNRENDRTAYRENERDVETVTGNTSNSGSIFGNLFGGLQNSRTNLPFGLESGDIAILALLFFLYRESGDEEFLIILAFFAFGILTK